MDMEETSDPFELFGSWFAAASRTEKEANAMALATSTPGGIPSVRMVLLKGVDLNGFVFYTNLESRKGSELKANHNVALCFHWLTPEHRQVRVEGTVEAVSNAEADAYYQSRARDSRLGAWASIQSRPLDSRRTLENRVADVERRFGGGEITRPPFWSGFRVVPRHIEFWQDRPYRLHDRIRFSRAGGAWQAQRLYP